jgi:C1A family cysteine protease
MAYPVPRCFTRLAHLLLLLSLLITVSAAWAQQRYPTGLRPLSPEERAQFERVMTPVENVQLNPLGLERVNQERAKRGRAPIQRSQAVTFGAEVNGAGDVVVGDGVALPSAVDNSTLACFPPIRNQGGLGSCAAFSTTYYTFTHMTGLARGWSNNNEDNTTKFSPKWTYARINGGADSGAPLLYAFYLLETSGAATWEEFPYVGNTDDPMNYREWPKDIAIWRNALSYRLKDWGRVENLDTETGLNQLKTLLSNGYILNYATYIYSWQYVAVQDDPSTTDDDAYVGKPIAYWMNGTDGGHGMTVVGYNDNIWVDINGNGQVDSGEKGALRIANSWGTGWKPDGQTADGGFTWLAYDALKAVSAVSGGPSSGRLAAFDDNEALWMTAHQSYTPTLIAQCTLNHPKRNQLGIWLGCTDTSITMPQFSDVTKQIYSEGGPYSLDGSQDDVDLTMMFDFTDLIPEETGVHRWHLYLFDQASDGAATLKDYRLIDNSSGGEEVASEMPVTVNNEEKSVYIDYEVGSSVVREYQPDLQVRTASSPTYQGDNLYNQNQTVDTAVMAGVTATYYVKLENDGDNSDIFTVVGSAGGDGWTVAYFDAESGGNNITEQVANAGWASPEMTAGSSRVLRVEVTPDSGTTGIKQVQLSATSLNDATRSDTVIMRTTVGTEPPPTDTYQPDLHIRIAGDPQYIGGGVYNNLTSQTVSQGVLASETMTCEVVLQNDGSTSDSFTLNATLPASGWTACLYNALTGGQDITAQLISGQGWTTPSLAAGATLALRIELTRTGNGTKNSQSEVLLSAKSSANATKTDAVKAVVSLANPLSKIRLIADPAKTAPAGSTVTLTAVATGGKRLLYRFFVHDGSSWTEVQPYSAANTCTYTPPVKGTYSFLVWVREYTSSSEWDMNASIWRYKVTASVMNATIAASANGVVGTPVTLTASATGPTAKEYAFYAYGPSGWEVIRTYATTSSCTWTPTGAGSYTLVVWAREVGSTRSWDCLATMPFPVATQ